MFETFISEFSSDIYANFFDPRKRLFIGYLGCALLIALAWLTLLKKQQIKHAWRTCFDKQVWFSKSSQADGLIFIINRLLFTVLAPALLAKLTIATFMFQWLQSTVGYRPLILLEDWQIAACFTLWLFILDDFARFYLHYLMHRWPVLWAFHKVHHSARTMTPLTVLRTHPVEGVLFSLRSSLVQGISIALFVFLFANQVDLITVLGANVLVFAFNVTGSNLRHSHIAIHYWQPLERWLISPAQHQIHHSTATRHFDKNFGATLAVWDRLFGCLHLSEPDTQLSFGISKTEEPDEHTLKQLYLQPFAEAVLLVKNALRKPRIFKILIQRR
ncbi:sterol desaturase family protein [Aliamphritea spongicola]|uniref:sterol desaturase family protein n=1 Tax=Aliamphritea spongicola TaxID=707589 RepID=UPI00196B3D67|nr:sterol desaturase family protein [Aliamphritea spongicola]MBN3563388.1 sterol desaturase family protein [Aliamphritea spongicola]